MSIILFIIGVVVVFYLHHIYNKRIDAEYLKATKTPGVATYLHNNFQPIIDLIDSSRNYRKQFENSYLLRYESVYNPADLILLQQSFGKCLIARIHIDEVVEKWELSKEDICILKMEEIYNKCDL